MIAIMTWCGHYLGDECTHAIVAAGAAVVVGLRQVTSYQETTSIRCPYSHSAHAGRAQVGAGLPAILVAIASNSCW